MYIKILRNVDLIAFPFPQITDPIYFLDNSGVYVKLTEEIYNNILEGKIRLWIRNFLTSSLKIT